MSQPTQNAWPGHAKPHRPSPGMYSLPPYHEAAHPDTFHPQTDVEAFLSALPTHRRADVDQSDQDSRWRRLRRLRVERAAVQADIKARDAAARKLYVRNRLILLGVFALLVVGFVVAVVVEVKKP